MGFCLLTGDGAYNLAGRSSDGDNGPAASAPLANASGVAVDSSGNLYIAEPGGARVRKVSGGVITTVAGNGTGGDGGQAISAALNGPIGVAVDASGNLYIADQGSNRIRKVSGGVITIRHHDQVPLLPPEIEVFFARHQRV
jgi:sugar lactone lactonase YvrE